MAQRYSPDPDVAGVAALIGDPARAAMLHALLGGSALAAGDLAARAGISAPSASAHLAKLVAGNLLAVETSGRYRLYRLASARVAEALERLAAIASPARIVALSQNAIAQDLRLARSCYDHLAGRLGVAVTEALIAQRALVARDASEFRLTPAGETLLVRLGVDVADARTKRRRFARQCVDWSERRPHLAGALGAALRARFLAGGWVAATKSSRALRITPHGTAALADLFSVEL